MSLRIISDGKALTVKYRGDKAQVVVTQEVDLHITVPEVLSVEVFMRDRGAWKTLEGRGVHDALEFGIVAMELAALSGGSGGKGPARNGV